MKGEFMVWRAGRPVPGVCLLGPLEGVPDDFELLEGIPRAGGWPGAARCAMDPRTPRDIRLADGLYGDRRIVVSPKVQALVRAESRDRIELLPIGIVDHKGRFAAKDYAIVNPLDVVDCIDQASSRVRWNAIDPKSIYACDALHLVESAVPKERKVFRLEGWRNVVVVRRELAEKLSRDTVGLHFVDPATYTGCI
jgi:hypothetical protein